MYVYADLAKQIVEAADFLLQVFSLDNQLPADSLGFLLRVQRDDQLLGGPKKRQFYQHVKIAA